MRGLGQIVGELARYRRQYEAAAQPAAAAATSARSRVREVTGFGSNPGQLRMFAYVPERLPAHPALVVVLHGCTQTARGYDVGAGWSTLADRYGFVLVLPEQQAANNPKTCFSWFVPADTRRDEGEALSIRQMVEHACADHDVDRRRIFITGLSAGGAMAASMLATYPDVFAGGAIIAGLPHGAAGSVQEAFESMFQGRSRTPRQWGDLVRKASPHKGPWPRVSIWHGTADTTVKPSNAAELVKQWTDVQGMPARPSGESVVDGHPRRVWLGPDGSELIEEYSIAGMTHGTPLRPGGADGIGKAGPFMLDAGIASSYHIARFWGLTGGEARRAEPRAEPQRAPEPAAAGAPSHHGAIHDIITKALRAVGLMKD